MPESVHKDRISSTLQRQIDILERRIDKLNQQSLRCSIARFVVFVSGLLFSLAVHNFFIAWLGWVIALVSVMGFSYLVYRHRRIEESLTRHRLWHEIKTIHIARIQLVWEKLPSKLAPSLQPEHPFGSDLDVTGERSLHALLDTAISRNGSERLRDWLLTTTPHPELTLTRQALVRELTPLALFRDKLTLTAMLASKNSKAHWESATLIAWLEKNTLSDSLFPTLIGLSALASIGIILFSLNQLGTLPNLWIYSFVLYAILYFTQRNQISSLFDEALSLENVLDKFSFVFRYLETRRPKNKPHLRKLCEPFLDPQNRPSRHLRHIARISQAAQLQRNPFLWLIVNAVFPWDLYFVFRLHQHRAKIAKLLPRWLDVWFELEALLSLANFAHLHPDYTFPKIVSPERESSVLLEARSLGHPLISPREKVCNDFKLTAPGEIAIVTGSNMSGKSTFLRTIGINLRLAQAGGPVNAREFTTTPFRVFACIKVSDSLADGISYFYAEVKRLKTLLLELQKPHPAPLFFLIDEIFKGTNHRERLLGSSAYIRALTREKGLGLIATHDLELVKLENEFSQIKNYHFREEIFDGRMLFDYKLHPGPCPTTNALKIMEMEGLPVSL